MPESKRIEIQVLRYRPEQEDEPVLAELLRAVHRRHVGPAGPAAHQGRHRRHAELPLVVPDGHLRQLRHDGQRQSRSCRARPSCATCCPGRCASKRWRISRSSATWSSASSGFVKKLESVKPYIIPKKPRTLDQGEYLQTPEQLEQFEQFSSCINCMLCYAACPQFGLNPDFIGPGVLALLHRYNVDSRDGGRDERMEIMSTEEGVWDCTAVGYCSEVCPKHVDPANAVNQNKVNSAKDYFLRFLSPKGASK